MSVTTSMLNRIPVFDRLLPDTLARLAHHMAEITEPAQTTFYHQDGSPTGLYALASGRVRLYRQSQDRMQILALPLPGECFGAESLPAQLPSPCAASALTRTTVYHIPPDTLRTLSVEYTDLQVVLLDVITARLRQFVDLVHNLAFRDTAGRLAAVLLARATTEGIPVGDEIHIERLLTQQELAAMIGTAREVVSRTFKRFEQDGITRLTRTQIVIIDLHRLAHIAKQEVR